MHGGNSLFVTVWIERKDSNVQDKEIKSCVRISIPVCSVSMPLRTHGRTAKGSRGPRISGENGQKLHHHHRVLLVSARPRAAVIPAQTAEDVRNIISTLSGEPRRDQSNRQTQQKFTIYILMAREMGDLEAEWTSSFRCSFSIVFWMFTLVFS